MLAPGRWPELELLITEPKGHAIRVDPRPARDPGGGKKSGVQTETGNVESVRLRISEKACCGNSARYRRFSRLKLTPETWMHDAFGVNKNWRSARVDEILVVAIHALKQLKNSD